MSEITSIDVVFSADALFGNATPAEEYDREASADAYRVTLVDYLYDEYPHAEINVRQGVTDQIWVNEMADHREVGTIQTLMERAWNNESWLVRLKG